MIRKLLWKLRAMWVIRHWRPGYFGSWMYAEGLWEIATDSLLDGDSLMSPEEALSIDQQYWEE